VVRIEPLNHQDPSTAAQIHAVLLLAYAQEANLLQVLHFAPLDRTPEDIRTSREYWLGALQGNEIVGSLSLGPDDEPDQISIASLVVHPGYQRQGIGRSLIAEALRRGTGMTFSVSTGVKNKPALALYEQFGFVAYRRGAIGPETLELVKLRASAP